jgi:protein-tyrosine sulfotransferase
MRMQALATLRNARISTLRSDLNARSSKNPNWIRVGDIVPMLRRVLGLRYLTLDNFLPPVGDEADAARIRGLALRARGAGPAPFLIFGVMPRSGTNYVRDILAAHPDVWADPGRLYEFPLLHAARGAAAQMDELIAYFPPNAEVVGRYDGLAMLAGGWLRELQSEAGDRHILLKSPHVQNLTLAPLIFPGAKILLCMRDGRDVIDSTLRTFSRRTISRKTFSQLAWEWRHAAEAIQAFDKGGRFWTPDMLVVRYEDLVTDHGPTLDRMLDHLGLDPSGFDRRRSAELPVRGSSRSSLVDAARWQPQSRTDDFKPIGRWTSWSAGRKARFERIAGDVLERAGYARAG